MTIWVLHQLLTPEEQANIERRSNLILPFDNVPDLSEVSILSELRQLLRTLHPEEPPETIQRQIDYIWPRYSELHLEDIMVVPLPQRREVALMQVEGIYQYRVGVSGGDEHVIPVKWLKTVKASRLRKHRDILASPDPMMEVTRAEARIAIRNQLPYSYNRFVKWKWLLVVFFALGLVRLVMQLSNRFDH